MWLSGFLLYKSFKSIQVNPNRVSSRSRERVRSIFLKSNSHYKVTIRARELILVPDYR